MKKVIKALALAATMVCGAMSAQAATVNIGGLNVPTGAHFEVASIYENVITGVGQTLSGVGEVTQINGQAISTLCAGCELTYSFSGYVVTAITATEVRFSGGIIKVYLDFGGVATDFNPFLSANSAADLARATDGTLFLTLAGHSVNAAGDTFIGSGTNIGLANAVGNGSGLADVVRGAGLGIAQSNFDTNSIAALFGSAFTDFQIGSSFSSVFVPHTAECVGGLAFTGAECLSGSSDFRGLVIPEPESLALFGVALLGLVASTKRRNKAAEATV